MKKIVLFSIFIFLTSIVHAESPPLKVEISVQQDSLRDDFYKKLGRFYVSTKIKNISNENQEIIVWTQYGWCWISNQPEILPGEEATNNIPSHITLKPNEEYGGSVEMFVSPEIKAGSVTFRLGFNPHAEGLAWKTMPDATKVAIWSNDVVINVTEEQKIQWNKK